MYISKNIQHDILFFTAAVLFLIFTTGLLVTSDSDSSSVIVTE